MNNIRIPIQTVLENMMLDGLEKGRCLNGIARKRD